MGSSKVYYKPNQLGSFSAPQVRFSILFSLTTYRNIVFGLLNIQLGIQLGSTCHSNRLGR